MNFDDKKKHVLRCIGLGMDFFSSVILAECTDKEIDILNNDLDFQRRIKIEGSLEEERLLNKHNSAMTLAADKGVAAPIQWKLERLNPRRWGSKEIGKQQIEPGSITINLIGRFPDGREC